MENTIAQSQYEAAVNELKKERLFLDVLCREYTSVFCLDFRNETLEILKLDSVANAYALFGNESRTKRDYMSVMEQYADLYVAEECRDDFLEVMDLCSLQERMKETDKFTYRYQSKPNKVAQRNFVAELRTIDDNLPELAILAFKNIDELVKDENERLQKAVEQKCLEAKVTQLNESYTQAKNREAILTALCSDYEVVYFCDLEADYLQVVKDSNPKAQVGTVCKFTDVVSIFKKLNNLKDTANDYVEQLDRERLMEKLRENPELSMQFSMKKNDTLTYMESRFIRVKSDSGFKVILGSRHIDDIVKKREERNRQLNEAVHEAQRANATKTEFLQRMSHDIRTPLNGICGMVEIAEHYSDDLGKQIECRDKVKESAKLLLELVNEVLDMNKLESGSVILEQVPFNLFTTAEEVFDVIEKLAEERGIQVICNGKDVVHWNVIGSLVHVKRIMMNMMSNAVKYNKDYGHIELACRELDSDREGESYYQFICRDTGIGMTAEFQKHIFEPFTQEQIGEKIAYSRTGLGMSITKKLVEAMGGTIEVESIKDEGSTFTVTIPFKIADEEAVALDIADEESVNLKDLNILLVEDNALNMEITEFMLQDKGAHVTKAWNGKEAVQAFEESEPGTYDIILMDIMMPEMDGYIATRCIRGSGRVDAKSVGIVAMSANAFTEDKMKAKEAGMDLHISKPISQDKLVRALNRIQREKNAET